MRVTNHYSSPLSIAGVDVRPGETVTVPGEAFSLWSARKTPALWIAQGLVTTSEEVATVAQEVAPGPEVATEVTRESLVEKARSLGLNPNKTTSVAKLVSMIKEAENG